MEPVRIQLSEIIDFGDFVTLVGVDAETNEPVAVYVDRRPDRGASPQALPAADRSEPLLYDAQRLTLTLDVLITGPEGM